MCNDPTASVLVTYIIIFQQLQALHGMRVVGPPNNRPTCSSSAHTSSGATKRQDDDLSCVMIWSEYDARQLQVEQVGTSACGATAAINVLVSRAVKARFRRLPAFKSEIFFIFKKVVVALFALEVCPAWPAVTTPTLLELCQGSHRPSKSHENPRITKPILEGTLKPSNFINTLQNS